MKTEVLSMKLPIHEATLVRRQAAQLGLTKSLYGANLVLRGLQAESADRLPTLMDRLGEMIDQFEELTRRVNQLEAAIATPSSTTNNDELRAFMIEVLLILREFKKNDLRLAGEIGRKLQRAVGDIRVEGT